LGEKAAVESGATYEAGEPQLLAVERGYRNVLRVRYALFWGVLAVAGLVAGLILRERVPQAIYLPAVLIAIAIFVVAVVPERVYRRLRYRLTDRLLQVMRGWMFHSDTVVPLVRVQHLDVVRGPLDKLFGTASLVVHTAGTLNSIVTVPGLDPGRAAEIRDTIREHVRTDFE
jgi:membrane protein YdbS with pleckstrin-like domain